MHNYIHTYMHACIHTLYIYIYIHLLCIFIFLHPNRLAPLSISSGQVAEKALEISGLALEFFPEVPGHGGVFAGPCGAAPIAGWSTWKIRTYHG